ncbi:hypothetical protein CCUS01_09680, partial [Colletotrichum cuscutae]
PSAPARFTGTFPSWTPPNPVSRLSAFGLSDKEALLLVHVRSVVSTQRTSDIVPPSLSSQIQDESALPT